MIRQEVSVGIYPQKVYCPVPSMNGANNHVVEIFVTKMLNRDFPTFFYYLDTRLLTFYDSFDQDTIMNVFEPDFSSASNTVIEWMAFDERFGRSIAKMTSYLSPLKPRSMILSKSALINQVDQQLHLEFVPDLNSVGNVELWYVSQKDQSYYVYSSVNLDSDGTYSLSISYRLGESTIEQMTTKVIKCPDYALGTVHTLEMKLVRPEIEMMNHNITLFNEWISGQSVSTNISNPVPDESWRIDAVLKKGYSVICSQSFGTDKFEVELFKQMFLSEGLLAISQSLPLNVQKPSSPVLNIDRVWISCQYDASGCNVTHVPKNFVNSTTSDTIANLVQQQGKVVVAAVSSVAGSLFLLFLLLAFVPGIIFVVWKLLGMRGKREKQAKLDAWKFEFELNRNVSSLDDKRFSVSRRVYQTSHDENKLKGTLKKFAQVRDYEMSDVSTGSDSEME